MDEEAEDEIDSAHTGSASATSSLDRMAKQYDAAAPVVVNVAGSYEHSADGVTAASSREPTRSTLSPTYEYDILPGDSNVHGALYVGDAENAGTENAGPKRK